MLLDARQRIIGFTEVARGSLNVNRLQGRDVFGPAIVANVPQ